MIMMMHAPGRLLHDRSASVAAAFALAIVPALYLTGVAIDYGKAARLQEQGNAQSIQAAQSMFNAQAATIVGLAYDPGNLTVTVQDAGLKRTVAVSYKAGSQTLFAGVLGQPQIPISGLSQATTMVPPNIDFYLLLDNSPSMAVAATTADINTMVANTPDKCAFACHESDTSPNDYYGLARKPGVTLRIDNLRTATQNLMSFAQRTHKAI